MGRYGLAALALGAVAMICAVILDLRGPGELPRSRRILPEYAELGGATRVRWEYPGEEPFTLVHAAQGEFSLAGVPDAVVEPAAARDVLATLEHLSYVATAGPDNLAERGLDAPRLTVHLFMARDRDIVLHLGRHVAEVDRVWLALERTPQEKPRVYLIAGHAARALMRRAADLRRRRVFAVAREDIRAMELAADDNMLVLAGRPLRVHLPGAPPQTVLADAAQFAALADRLRALAVDRFVATPPRAGSGDPEPLVRIRVQTEHASHELAELGPCPGVPDLRLAATSVGTGCVAAAALERLRADAAHVPEFFAKSPLGAEPLTELVVTAPGQDPIRLRADGRTWSMTDPETGADTPGGRQTEPGAVEEWIYDIQESGQGHYVPAPVADARPVLLLAATSAAGRPMQVAVLARQGALLAHRDSEPVALSLDFEPHAGRVLPVTPLRFRRRQLLALDPYAVRRVTRLRNGRPQVRLQRGQLLDEWTVELPPGRAPRPGVMDPLRELSRLRARAFVADAPEPAHGLADPVRIELLFDPDPLAAADMPVRHIIDMGASTPTGCVARLDEDGPVFELKTRLCDLLLGSWLAP